MKIANSSKYTCVKSSSVKRGRISKSSEEPFRASEKQLSVPMLPQDPELLESRHFGRFVL